MEKHPKPQKPDVPHRYKSEDLTPPAGLRLAAMGMEAEFELYVDDRHVRPEDQFGSPQAFLRGTPMHRTGTSYQLPTGGAVYFDSGVMEIATPVIELAPGCAARAGRSLWEGILYLRQELDAWQRRTGHDARLVGFSTHYNISFEQPAHQQQPDRTVEKLAHLLTYLLPLPVMLTAANPASTGIGVRPREDRIEVTADFTPSPALLIATGALIVGIVRAVMRWPSFEQAMLAEQGLPVVEGFAPMPHTSRKGWLARYDCFPQNPFTVGVEQPLWTVQDAFWTRLGEAPRPLTLREIGTALFEHFRRPIRRLADPFTFHLLDRIFQGASPTLLHLDRRPSEYEDVGRLCFWDNLFPERLLNRSRYERVLIRAIGGHTLRLEGQVYTPRRLRGWSEVVFRREGDRAEHVFSIDALLDHLDAWERTPQ